MDFYVLSLVSLVLLNACAVYYQRRVNVGSRVGPEEKAFDDAQTGANFKKRFFLVYVLVAASDWLQVRSLQFLDDTSTTLKRLI